MRGTGHFIERCLCGKVLAQCRCPGPKTEHVIGPCQHIETGDAEPEAQPEVLTGTG